MTTSPESGNDKSGDALNGQRFQMLEDIARELTGEVIFPTSFNTTLRLRQELQNPDLPIVRVATIVSVEPLVVAKLIRLANSALYSPDGVTARNLPAAIARLGVELVRTTALAIAMTQLLRSKEMAAFSELAHALWRHSIKTSAAARILARSHTVVNPDDAALAGLVHDLGAFYMLYRAAQYPELLDRPDTIKFLIMRWHEGIGVSLLHALHLPEEIVDATIDHDHPRKVPPTTVRSLPDIVYVANVLAGAHFEWFYQDIDPERLATTAIKASFADVLPEIEAESEELLAVLG